MNEPTNRARVLTLQQRKFCIHYVGNGGNGAKAVRDSGYVTKQATEYAARLLDWPEVQFEIERLREAAESRLLIKQDAIVQELAAMSFYDAGELGKYNPKKPEDIQLMPERLRRAIVGWTWDKEGRFVLKLAAKTPNLELLGAYFGMWTGKAAPLPKDAETPEERTTRLERIRREFREMLDGMAVPEPLTIEQGPLTPNQDPQR